MIDPGDTLSYVSPKVIEQCCLQVVKFKNPCLVQLAIGVKTTVLAKVSNFPLKLAGQPIMANLNVLPLGSHNFLIGMDWVEKRWSLINYKYKTLNYMDLEGIR